MFGGVRISTETNVFLFHGYDLNYFLLEMSRPFKTSSYFAIIYFVVFQINFSVRDSLSASSKKRGIVTTVQTNSKTKTVIC